LAAINLFAMYKLIVIKKSDRITLLIVILVSIILLLSCTKKEVPVLTTLEISNITAITATCGGNITDDGNSQIISRGVCWSTNAQPTIADNLTSDSTGVGAFVSIITGLTQNTTYNVRAYATNSEGTGYGNEMVFTTETGSLPVVTTAPVTYTYFWYLTGGNVISDGNMPVRSRGVCWSTNQSPTILDTRTQDGTGTGTFESTITLPFSPLTTYYVRAYATNDVGTAYGGQNSFTAPCVRIPEEEIHLVLYSPSNGATGESLNTTLKWRFGTNGSGFCDVYLGTSSNQLNRIAEDNNSKMITLNGLILGTTYYWRVIAKDIYAPCNNDTSSIYHFTTINALIAPSVATLSDTSFTSTTASVGGNVTNDGGNVVSEYGIFWGPNTDPELTGTKLKVGSGMGTFSTVITSLNPSSTYYVRAYATNVTGTGYGSQIRFHTGQRLTNTTISDVEGNVYHVVEIGSQVWMADNLKTTRYADGKPIPFINTNASWIALDINDKAYCWYDDNSSNKDIYGALYTWGAAMNGAASSTLSPSRVQGVCPAGWHLPSYAEWSTLGTYLGGFNSAGGRMKETGTEHWFFNNAAGNESGFTALPGGQREGTLGYLKNFRYLNNKGFWWTSQEVSDFQAAYFSLVNNSTSLSTSYSYKNYGYSVRCLRD
jgi:uncharacterized protein (TIGR02145 family)